MPWWGVMLVGLIPSGLVFLHGIIVYDRRLTTLQADMRWVKQLLVQNGFATQREADNGGS